MSLRQQQTVPLPARRSMRFTEEQRSRDVRSDGNCTLCDEHGGKVFDVKETLVVMS